MEGLRAQARVAGGIARAGEHRLVVDGLVAEAPQLGDAGVERVAGKRAGGRDEGDPIAGPQRARFIQANLAISAATA
jgi:hypothetical protein